MLHKVKQGPPCWYASSDLECFAVANLIFCTLMGKGARWETPRADIMIYKESVVCGGKVGGDKRANEGLPPQSHIPKRVLELQYINTCIEISVYSTTLCSIQH